jgi:hypothetical protein
MPTANVQPAPGQGLLPADEILRIARKDAEAAYRDLSAYRITLVLERDGWHVDYDLTQPLVAGGGPHYVIDPLSGQILTKRYDQ